MLVYVDVIGLLEKAFKKEGFRDNGPILGSAGRLHAHGGKKIITIRPIKLPAGAGGELFSMGGLSERIDDFFERLLIELKRVHAEGNTPCDLIFQGGGTTPLPDWFRRAVEALGYSIIIVNLGLGDETEILAKEGRSLGIQAGEYLERLQGEIR